MNDNHSLLLASAVLAASSTIPVRAAWVAGVDGHGYETLERDGVTIVYEKDAAHPGGIVLREVRSAPAEGDWTLDALADIERDTGLVPTAIGPGFVHSRDGRLKSFAIPATVRSLGAGAFSGCVGATNALALPAGLEELGDAAFWICGNLTGDLVIPAGVERIGPETFYGCERLTGLSFAPGSRLRSIAPSCGTGRAGAFAKCRGLRGTVDFSPCRDLESIDPVAFVDAGPMERFVYGREFLARKAAQLRAADAANGYPRASTDWLAGAFGISTHWTFATTDQKGERNPFEEAVDAFDVPRYVAQAKRAGAEYVIFTSTWGSFHLRGGASTCPRRARRWTPSRPAARRSATCSPNSATRSTRKASASSSTTTTAAPTTGTIPIRTTRGWCRSGSRTAASRTSARTSSRS